MKKRQLEEKMTRKWCVMSRIVGKQYEPNQNNEEKVKPKEGRNGGCKREHKQGGGKQEHGVRLKAAYGPGFLWELLGITIGAVLLVPKIGGTM